MAATLTSSFLGCANRGMRAPSDASQDFTSPGAGGLVGTTDSGMTGTSDARVDQSAAGTAGSGGYAGEPASGRGGGSGSAGASGAGAFGGDGMGGASGEGGAGSGGGGTTAGASGSGGGGGVTGVGGTGTGGNAGAAGGGTSGGGRGGSGGGAGGTGGQAGAGPVVISVDFVGGGVAMAVTEVAGAVRVARWNSAALATGALTSLVASTGTTTSGAVSWNGENVYQLGIPDAPGDARMMNGYLDPVGMATVTVTGLPISFTNRGYDVYVYASGHVPSGDLRTASYAVGGMMMTLMQSTNTPYTGTYIHATGGGFGNYLVFPNVTSASFTLSATPGPATRTRRSPLNGLQIVARP
jgi:hypothetical protein